MQLATKTLNKQKRTYSGYLLRGLVLMGLGIYAGVMILKNGMGSSVETGGGANVWIRKLMAWLTEQGVNADELIPICMVGLFFIIAAIGLFNVVRGAWKMIATHTILGKSVLTQKKGAESFQDVIDSINADMEQEPYCFGTVSIGRKWILDTEAMRLDDIHGFFYWDAGMEEHILCCVDEAQNIWAASLRYSDDRDKAAEYLKKTLPNIPNGGKNAYEVFLEGKPIISE